MKSHYKIFLYGLVQVVSIAFAPVLAEKQEENQEPLAEKQEENQEPLAEKQEENQEPLAKLQERPSETFRFTTDTKSSQELSVEIRDDKGKPFLVRVRCVGIADDGKKRRLSHKEEVIPGKVLRLEELVGSPQPKKNYTNRDTFECTIVPGKGVKYLNLTFTITNKEGQKTELHYAWRAKTMWGRVGTWLFYGYLVVGGLAICKAAY